MTDVAAASAAVLFNLLPEISELPDAEKFERLKAFLEGTLAAAGEWKERRLEPSDN